MISIVVQIRPNWLLKTSSRIILKKIEEDTEEEIIRSTDFISGERVMTDLK